MNMLLHSNHSFKKTKIWKPLVAAILWGFSFIGMKYALFEVEPVVIVLIRQLLGIILLSLLAVKTRNSFSITMKDFMWIVLLSVFTTFHMWIQLTGLKETTATNSGWIIGLTPVFIAILGAVFFREKITLTQFTGIVIAFLGLLLLVGNGDFSSIDFISNKGDFLVLASSFTWSVYTIITKKITLNYPPMMTILYLFVMMSIFVSPFAINQTNINAVLHLSVQAIAALLFLGIFCSGVAYVLWAQALSEMPSTKVGAFLYIEPFVNILGAWLLLSEHITLLIMISGLIILGGVVMVNRK